MQTDAPATVADIRALATGLPHVTVWEPDSPRPVYQVGGKSFVFFRTPRPDAVDPVTGERYADVVVFWVPDLAAKEALVLDPSSPFFSTPHFDGHPSVLVRLSRLAKISRTELTEIIEDAWLSRASARRGRLYLEGPDRITG